MRIAFVLLFAASLIGAALGPKGATSAPAVEEAPKSTDPRLVIELFAANPDIVHPISIECDAQGRLLVIESHTHFPPPNYQGPKHDRIRMFEDTKGTGKADRITTFFEGTEWTMDIARHPDGSIYLATRNEILRLRDTKGTGKADKKQRIAFLETAGRYPHNGISGLCFDFKGNLYFGVGENLGADYKLIGSDGVTLTGGGEGGNIFWCTAAGGKLRRVATGFWNPFGICQDIYGRMFAVDNDPDEMPPCRMLHVVEGGDYGYQFRYGRSGRHIFQAWNGELPGSLPYMTGTGEAPCEVISYESDGLPSDYLGDLLVASWADHRIERYQPKAHGASYTAEMKPLIQGGKNFRPVGIALAPDGSLYVSDWVLSDYQLHGRGAIWHVRWKDAPKPLQLADPRPRQALLSLHRPTREAAARELITNQEGLAFLRSQLHHTDSRVRATALTALIDGGDAHIDLTDTAKNDPVPAIRAMAIREMAKRGRKVGGYFQELDPALRMEAVAGLKEKADLPALVQLLEDKDPFLRHAAIHQLSQAPQLIADIHGSKLSLPQRLGVLLAWRASGHPDGAKHVAEFLADADEEVLFLAAKWMADEKLSQYRPWLVDHLRDSKLSIRLFQAYTTALARIDNQDVSEAKMAEAFIGRLVAESVPPDAKIMAMRLTPATHQKLTIELLKQLLAVNDAKLRLETVRLLNEHPNGKRFDILREIAFDSRNNESVRAQALVGLAERAQDSANELVQLAAGSNPILRDEALRDLINVKLTPSQQTTLGDLAKREPAAELLVARVLGQPFFKDRPRPEDQSAWLKRLEAPGNPQAGHRIFYHSKLGGCARCHRIDGRGQDIGPDLSDIHKIERRAIVESILQPSANVAPRYQAWLLEFNDGRVKTGMLHRTVLDDYTYVDEKGALFKVNTRDLANTKALATSIMPAGLIDLLTDQELRDLIAFLTSPR